MKVESEVCFALSHMEAHALIAILTNVYDTILTAKKMLSVHGYDKDLLIQSNDNNEYMGNIVNIRQAIRDAIV